MKTGTRKMVSEFQGKGKVLRNQAPDARLQQGDVSEHYRKYFTRTLH